MQRLSHIKVPQRVLVLFLYLILSILLGFLWFILLYGRFPLYGSHVNWIYNAGGDMLQHQLGWEWFRQEPWRFPLGSIERYGYPVGTSVAFMDSIPLFAIPFKLVSPWLKPDFQYFGIWELTSIIGQLFIGLLILREFTRSYPLKILGASLLVLSPPMIFRAFYHSSLSAHWILLAGIWFILLEYRRTLWRGAWVALFAVTMWVHIYFIPMLLPMWLIGMYFRCQKEKRIWTFVVEILAVGGAIFLAGFSTGVFNLAFDSLSSTGFGLFSWNLNGFINPFSFGSAYGKPLLTGTSGQYEGFSYMGLGNLVLLPIALYLFFYYDSYRKKWNFILPVAAAALVFTLFALSNKAFLDSLPLWDFELPDPVAKLFNLFRTSGRFIWPVYYFLVLFAVIGIIRNTRNPALILILVLLLQARDVQPLYESKRLADFTKYPAKIEGEFWQSAARINQHLVIIPAYKLTPSYEPMAVYAVHQNLTLNLGYFARSDARAMDAYRNQVWNELKDKKPDNQTLYVLTEPEFTNYAKTNLTDSMFVCKIDGYHVLFSKENPLAEKKYNYSRVCSVPDLPHWSLSHLEEDPIFQQ